MIMETLIYNLPEIVFGIVALVTAILFIAFIRERILCSRGKTPCMHCKTAASRIVTPAYLFLLPVSFDARYTDPENYLLSHMQPVLGKGQIPTGRRACHLDVYQCSKCGRKQVVITDFLQVRGEENPEGTYVFAYDAFRPLIERWEAIGRRPDANI